MKKSVVLITVMVLMMQCLLGVESYADYYYDINAYDITIVVNRDNTYEIVETIEVQFYEPRHGIYRKIPLDYNGRNNKIRDIKVYNPVNNEPYHTEISKENNYLTIQVGHEDVLVDNTMTYVIAYTYDGGIDFDKSMDEFYFNLIGTEWDAQIDKVTFNISMPKDFNEQYVSFTSGYRGSVDHDKVDYSVANNVIIGSVKEPLQSFEALTMALPLEEGYYDEVEANVNMLLFYVMFGIIATCLLFVVAYASRLKRENRLVPIVTFNPPDDLNPPEVAYIYKKENLQLSNVATLILKWASQGCLKIDETERHGLKKGYMTLTKLKELPVKKSSYERQLFKTMFNKGDGTIVTTDELAFKFYRNLTTVVNRVKKKFSGDKEILINKYQVWTKIYAILYLLISTLAIAYITSVYLRTNFMVNYLMALLGGILLLVIYGIVTYFSHNKVSISSKLFVGIFCISFGLPMLGIILASIGPVISLLKWNGTLDLTIFLLYIVCQGITLLTIWTIKVYSDFGREKIGQIEGFRTFIKTAKIDQLEMLYKENPAYFYEILPYAMVLELTDVWDKYVTKMAVMPPTWYTSTSAFNSHAFTSSMDRTFRSASTQPSSSSSSFSSSGGSSGGGGGGGGGGSW